MKQERVIYFSEICRFFQKKQRVVFRAALFGCGTVFCFILCTGTPLYKAKATFFQAPNVEEEMPSLRLVLQKMHGGKEGSSALGVMQSRPLLKEVVREMGLQVVQKKSPTIFPLLRRELGGDPRPSPFLFREVAFFEEQPLAFSITPLSEHTFEVRDHKRNLLSVGELGKRVKLDRASFILTKMGKAKRQALFTLISERDALAKLKKRLKIKPSKVDMSLLHLQYLGADRETAITLLDTLMDRFHRFVDREHRELADAQIAYLQRRKGELSREFDRALEEHVRYLKEAGNPEGYFGLAEEVEMLSQPKEIYGGRKHELDLEGRTWERHSLEARATHPWVDGRERKDALQLQQGQWGPLNSIDPAEFAGVDLETAESLYEEATRSRDRLFAQLNEWEGIQKQLEDPRFSLASLSGVLTDPPSQKIIQRGTTLAFQIADKANHSEREIARSEIELAQQRGLLKRHLAEKISLLQLQVDLIEKKMVHLQGAASYLIGKEQKLIDEKLEELAEKMGHLPEKWQRESQLKFKRQLAMQILEGLATLSEGKVINHHLFHVTSKALEPADAPIRIEKPRLIAYASMGGIIGGSMAFLFLLLRALSRGFPLSKEYLEDQGYTALVGNEKSEEEKWKQIYCQIKPGEVVGLIATEGKHLANLSSQNHLTTLRVTVGKEVQQEICESHRVIGVETLLDQNLPGRLYGWKTDFSCILIEVDVVESAEAQRLATLADRIILTIQEESEKILTPFTKEKTLCLLKK